MSLLAAFAHPIPRWVSDFDLDFGCFDFDLAFDLDFDFDFDFDFISE
jgi:hypothetical protein